MVYYYTFDGFTPVNITPKQRANSSANDMTCNRLRPCPFSLLSFLSPRIFSYIRGEKGAV